MSVLGPLSIDPNMLNTQKQQVQVHVAENPNMEKELSDYLIDLCFLVYAA